MTNVNRGLKKMETKRHKIDPATTVIPFVIILVLCTIFGIKPEGSTNVIGLIRSFLGDKFGLYYLIVGLGILLVSFWIAFSDIDKIRLGGKNEKSKYNFFTWGSMIFTCGLAADILFYSFVEWIYYSQKGRVATSALFRNGLLRCLYFTGNQFLGVFMQFLQPVLVLCFMFVAVINRNIQKPAVHCSERKLINYQESL